MKAIRVKNRLLGMLVSAALCFGAGAALAADFSIKVAYAVSYTHLDVYKRQAANRPYASAGSCGKAATNHC